MYICERCGKEFEEDYRLDKSFGKKNPPRFCSRACANTRIHSKETKLKISNSVRTSEKAHLANERAKEIRRTYEWKNLHRLPRLKKICPACGKEFETTETRNKIYCSQECWNKTSGGLREGSGRSKSGYYKGEYYGSTYELCWAIYNIDHNIPFRRSKIQIPYIYNNENHIYYPDFELEDGTIIEIKGYYSDLVKIKTEATKKAGYKIKVLYKRNLEKIFDYIKETYKVFDFAKLYDSSKNIFTYICDICGKEFKRTKELKEGPYLCSRSCSCKNASLHKKSYRYQGQGESTIIIKSKEYKKAKKEGSFTGSWNEWQRIYKV